MWYNYNGICICIYRLESMYIFVYIPDSIWMSWSYMQHNQPSYIGNAPQYWGTFNTVTQHNANQMCPTVVEYFPRHLFHQSITGWCLWYTVQGWSVPVCANLISHRCMSLGVPLSYQFEVVFRSDAIPLWTTIPALFTVYYNHTITNSPISQRSNDTNMYCLSQWEEQV